jgi:hypothetical protein
MNKCWLPKSVREAFKEKKTVSSTKGYLKKCVCGTEEYMYKLQVRCCACIAESKQKEKAKRKYYCTACGRHSFGLVNGLCSFCKQRQSSELVTEPPRIYLYCKSCTCRILKVTAEKYGGVCKNCAELKEMEIQVLCKKN